MGASEPVTNPNEVAAFKDPNPSKDIINVGAEEKSTAEPLIRKSIIGKKNKMNEIIVISFLLL